MDLGTGSRLGRYEIISSIGSGGMGAVYKARDSRLNRTVAIKILLEKVSERADLKERFRREAYAIANLNHPNICRIHDVGHQDGVDYLVMEHVEGETLAHRLERGPLQADQVIKFAIEMADALDKVHRQGVVHRDLKPGNVMLTRSGAKLLDFGLAKVIQNPAVELSGMTEADITAEGTILGTLQYMSPEQLQGKEADARSDIFSLGAILYEMLAGRKAFAGDNPATVIAAIVEREPEFFPTLQDRKLKGLDYVLRRCIPKNPEDRWQSAHDLLLQLRWLALEELDAAGDAVPDAALNTTAGRASRFLSSVTRLQAALLLGVLAVVLAAVVVITLWSNRSAEAALIRFPIYAPQNRIFLSPGGVSPDGKTVAFMSDDEKGDRIIWLRSLDGLEGKPLPGTEEALSPFFWSPDSKTIAFSTPGYLKKMAVPNGPAQTLARIRGVGSGAWGGGTWGADGTILFSPGPDQPLFRVPATGGTPSPVTTLDASREEAAHVWPHFLPDGKHFLYLARSRNPEKTGVYAGSLDSGTPKRILDGNTLPSYAAPGYLLFIRGDNLLAQAFDVSRLELSGDATVVASTVADIGGYSVSHNGVLTVNAGSWYPTATQLRWFGRKGQDIGAVGAPDKFYTPVVSPDGRDIAVERHLRGLGFLWLTEALRDRFQRFTLEGPHDQSPVWSRDGKFIAYTSELSSKGWIIRRKRLDAQGATEDLATVAGESYTNDWSPDGEFIAYETFDPETRWDVWLLPLKDPSKQQALLKTSFNERQVQFSANGAWIAYTSNQSGRNEVYVQKFPASGETWRISTNGGGQPRWSRDGRELFYVDPDQKLMAVDIKMSPVFEAGASRQLLQLRLDMTQGIAGIRNQYDVSPDGQQFLVNTIVGEPSSAVITVTLNWTTALKR